MEPVRREKDPDQAAEWADAKKLPLKEVQILRKKDVEQVVGQACGMEKVNLKNKNKTIADS